MNSKEKILMQLKNIVLKSLKDAPVNVYLFGSWARNEEKQTSDIDIAIESFQEIPIEKLVNLREEVEESTVPYNVDIVNLSNANEELIKKVKQEGTIWKDCMND